jgi:hypothetical protein
LVFFQTCKEGAQTTIYCAVSEDVKGESGKYYMDCKDYEHTIEVNIKTVIETFKNLSLYERNNYQFF